MAKVQENLIPLNKRSKDVQRKIQQMGRDANKAKWAEIKGLRDAARALLTDNVTDKDGKKVYTTDIVVEEHEFSESKGNGTPENEVPTFKPDANGFISIPDGIEEELPFL